MLSISNDILFGFTEWVKALQHVYAYMDVGGTIPGKESVELSLEQRPRATHDSKDGGGRNASGTAFEEQLPSSPVCTPGYVKSSLLRVLRSRYLCTPHKGVPRSMHINLLRERPLARFFTTPAKQTRLHGRRTTPWKEEVENVWNTFSR